MKFWVPILLTIILSLHPKCFYSDDISNDTTTSASSSPSNQSLNGINRTNGTSTSSIINNLEIPLQPVIKPLSVLKRLFNNSKTRNNNINKNNSKLIRLDPNRNVSNRSKSKLCAHQNGGCRETCQEDQDEEKKGVVRCGCLSPDKIILDNSSEWGECVAKNRCKDTEEELNGGCTHECVVEGVGLRSCRCKDGFDLFNETDCLAKDPCQYENGGCQEKCVHVSDYQRLCECFNPRKFLFEGTQCVMTSRAMFQSKGHEKKSQSLTLLIVVGSLLFVATGALLYSFFKYNSISRSPPLYVHYNPKESTSVSEVVRRSNLLRASLNDREESSRTSVVGAGVDDDGRGVKKAVKWADLLALTSPQASGASLNYVE